MKIKKNKKFTKHILHQKQSSTAKRKFAAELDIADKKIESSSAKARKLLNLIQKPTPKKIAKNIVNQGSPDVQGDSDDVMEIQPKT